MKQRALQEACVTKATSCPEAENCNCISSIFPELFTDHYINFRGMVFAALSSLQTILKGEWACPNGSNWPKTSLAVFGQSLQSSLLFVARCCDQTHITSLQITTSLPTLDHAWLHHQILLIRIQIVKDKVALKFPLLSLYPYSPSLFTLFFFCMLLPPPYPPPPSTSSSYSSSFSSSPPPPVLLSTFGAEILTEIIRKFRNSVSAIEINSKNLRFCICNWISIP